MLGILAVAVRFLLILKDWSVFPVLRFNFEVLFSCNPCQEMFYKVVHLLAEKVINLVNN